MLTINNPSLEKKIIKNAKKRNMSIELYITDIVSNNDFDINLRNEDEKNLKKELIDQIKESRQTSRSDYIDLSKKYA